MVGVEGLGLGLRVVFGFGPFLGFLEVDAAEDIGRMAV